MLGCAGSIMVSLVDCGLLEVIMGCQGMGGGVKIMGYLSSIREKEIRCPSVG